MEGTEGSQVKLKCNKCGKLVSVKIEKEKVILSTEPFGEPLKKIG